LPSVGKLIREQPLLDGLELERGGEPGDKLAASSGPLVKYRHEAGQSRQLRNTFQNARRRVATSMLVAFEARNSREARKN